MKFQGKVWHHGVLQRIQVEAVDKKSAAKMLQARGRLVGEVRPARTNFWRRHGLSSQFAEDLLILLDAGFSLTESLEVLCGGAISGGAFRPVELRESIMEGQPYLGRFRKTAHPLFWSR